MMNLALNCIAFYLLILRAISNERAVLTGCDDCQTSYVGECTKHLLTPVSDKVILSRAWASLPLVLQIFRLSETDDAQNAGPMLSNVAASHSGCM